MKNFKTESRYLKLCYKFRIFIRCIKAASRTKLSKILIFSKYAAELLHCSIGIAFLKRSAKFLRVSKKTKSLAKSLKSTAECFKSSAACLRYNSPVRRLRHTLHAGLQPS